MRHVDDLVKSGRRIVRNVKRAAVGTLIGAAALYVSACGDPRVEEVLCPIPVTIAERNDVLDCDDKNTNSNSPPVVDVTTSYGDGLSGVVAHTVIANDSDGIKRISVRINDGDWVNYDGINQTIIFAAIPPGKYSLDVYAIDKKEATSETLRIESYSPTELEVTGTTSAEDGIIDDVLVSNGYTLGTSTGKDYLKNVPLVNLCGDNINNVNYSINSAQVIENVSHTDNLQEKLADKAKLDCEGVPNIYFVYLTKPEIESRLQTWIDSGFSN